MRDLGSYDQSWFDRGRPLFVIVLWQVIQETIFRFSPPFADAFRLFVLRLFGAKIGKHIIIRPSCRITYPWRLILGDHVWIGEEVYIHNLESVEIEANSVVSQRAFLCTGSHDFDTPDFRLIVKPIVLEAGSWICASSFIGPGVKVGVGAVVTACSKVTKNIPAWSVWSGNPATQIKELVEPVG